MEYYHMPTIKPKHYHHFLPVEKTLEVLQEANQDAFRHGQKVQARREKTLLCNRRNMGSTS